MLVLLVLEASAADEVFLVSLACCVSTKAQERRNINTIHVFSAMSVAAEVKLCQQIFSHLFLSIHMKPQTHAIRHTSACHLIRKERGKNL